MPTAAPASAPSSAPGAALKPTLERAPTGTTVDPRLSESMLQLGRYLHNRQWMPAHGGNFSTRLADGRFLITADGSNKGALTSRDLITIDRSGAAVAANPAGPAPSSETPVHLALYQLYPKVNAVIHTHSIAATVLSRIADETMIVESYEAQRAIEGIDHFEGRLTLPVFSNYHDHTQLAHWFNRYTIRFPNNHGFLIRGHGLYTWGNSPTAALRHLEALEFILDCELRLAQFPLPEGAE